VDGRIVQRSVMLGVERQGEYRESQKEERVRAYILGSWLEMNGDRDLGEKKRAVKMVTSTGLLNHEKVTWVGNGRSW